MIFFGCFIHPVLTPFSSKKFFSFSFSMLVSSFHVGDSFEIRADPSSHIQERGPQRLNGSSACVHVCDVRRPCGAPLESDWLGTCFCFIGKTSNVNIFCSVLRKDGSSLLSGGFHLTVASLGLEVLLLSV